MDDLRYFKKELRFSKAQFEAVARTATDSIIISNDNSVIIYANKKTYEIFGYEEDEIMGREMGILMPEKYRELHRAGVKRYIDSAIPKLIGHTIELEGLRKDGSIFPLELSLSSWKEEDKYFFSGIIRDITERKQLSKEKDEDNLKLLKKQKELEAANEELMTIQEELQASNEEIRSSQEELQAANQELVKKEGILKEWNFQLEQKVSERTREQQLAQEEAERQKARLERFFMQAPASICILDGPELEFELINPLYQQMFPGRKLLGKPLLTALPEIVGQPIWSILQDVYQTGETFEGKEVLIPLARHEGDALEDIYFNFIYQARYDEQGNIDGILVFAYEVSDLVLSRKKVEASERRLQNTSDELATINEELAAANEEIQVSNEELSQSNQQLIRINSDLDNFIYTASHDLKAPITNIEGLLQVLLRSLSSESLADERTQHITGMMQSSIDRFKKTLTNLTDIIKLQKENSQGATFVSFSETIEEVILDMEQLIQSSNASIETNIEGCSSIHFSQNNLRSIVYNLLSNAIKYRSPERNPLVQVNCRQTDEYSIISVQDNGLGMHLSDTPKIFNMFKRLHVHVEGTGIGLYMIKKIIDNAGGKIEVESKVGEGSTFKVYLKR